MSALSQVLQEMVDNFKTGELSGQQTWVLANAQSMLDQLKDSETATQCSLQVSLELTFPSQPGTQGMKVVNRALVAYRDYTQSTNEDRQWILESKIRDMSFELITELKNRRIL